MIAGALSSVSVTTVALQCVRFNKTGDDGDPKADDAAVDTVDTQHRDTASVLSADTPSLSHVSVRLIPATPQTAGGRCGGR